MRYIACILIAGLACGCVVVHPVESLDSAQISDKAEVDHDSSKKITEVEGLKLVFGEFHENHYFLSANRTDGAPAAHYAFSMRTLRKRSLGGIGWKAAADEQGRPFTLVKEAVETNEDLLYESVEFELTREWLDLAATKEIKVQVIGAITNHSMVFPTNYVAGFLNRVDREFLLRN
jgi:hypothetical protein